MLIIAHKSLTFGIKSQLYGAGPAKKLYSSSDGQEIFSVLWKLCPQQHAPGPYPA